MKKLELNQIENLEGGRCTDQERMSMGATMLVLGAMSFGTVAIFYGLGAVMYCAA